MVKVENYMYAKYPEPTELIKCWHCSKQGTMWYRIADSHLSSKPESPHPHYWICSCDEHKPYTKLQTGIREPAMKDYSHELDMI